jgi:hypothetical protein
MAGQGPPGPGDVDRWVAYAVRCLGGGRDVAGEWVWDHGRLLDATLDASGVVLGRVDWAGAGSVGEDVGWYLAAGTGHVTRARDALDRVVYRLAFGADRYDLGGGGR